MTVSLAVTCWQEHKLRGGGGPGLSVNIDTKHGLQFTSAEQPDCQPSGCWHKAHYLCCTVCIYRVNSQWVTRRKKLAAHCHLHVLIFNILHFWPHLKLWCHSRWQVTENICCDITGWDVILEVETWVFFPLWLSKALKKQKFRRIAYLLSCRELDENIDTTRVVLFVYGLNK